MKKFTGSDILKYDKTKQDFYKKRQEIVQAKIDEEFSEFEKQEYGENLYIIKRIIEVMDEGGNYFAHTVLGSGTLLITMFVLIISRYITMPSISFESEILFFNVVAIIQILVGLCNMEKIKLYLKYSS